MGLKGAALLESIWLKYEALLEQRCVLKVNERGTPALYCYFMQSHHLHHRHASRG